MTARRGLALVACAALGACVTGQATFQTRVRIASADPIERMLIVTQIGGGKELREGISSTFQDHLAACGVRAVVVHIRALDLDPDQRVRDAAHQLQPSAVLTIFAQSDNGTVWFGSAEVTQEYKVRVVAARSSTVLWDSTMTWKLTSNRNTDWRGTGARFADSILGELRGSVLTRCRTEAESVAPPPATETGSW